MSCINIHVDQKKLIIFLALIQIFIPRRILFMNRIPLFNILTLFEILLIFYHYRTFFLPKSSICLPIILFYMLMSFSYLAYNDYLGILWLMIEFTGNIMVGYIIWKIEVQHELLKKICVVGILLAFFAIIHAVLGFNIFDPFNRLSGDGANGIRFGFQRVYGPFTTSINFGIFLGTINALVTYIIANAQCSNCKIYKFGRIMIWIAIILTLSRTAILFSIATQLLVLLIKISLPVPKKKLMKRIGAVIIAIVFVYIFNITEIIPHDGVIRNMYVSIIAIFDESSVVGTELEGMAGVADRDALTSWIIEDIEGNELIGNGAQASFSRYINKWRTKTSIENTYLFYIFHYGFLGVVGFIMLEICSIGYFCSYRKQYLTIDKCISFNVLMCVLLIVLFVTAVAYSIMDERRVYLLLVGYAFSANRELKDLAYNF